MRTDRTFVCTDCRVRCWPVRRCPACGETRSLTDLAETPDAIRRGPKLSNDRESAAGTLGSLGALGITGSISALASGMTGLAEVGLVLSLPLLLGGVALWPRGKKQIVPGDLRYRVLESPVVRASAERCEQVGTVRARALLESPLSGRACVAWRIWADGPFGELDDAHATAFAVDLGPGEAELAVDATCASIDLPRPDFDPMRLPEPDDALRTWLRARGVPDPTELLVREAILVEGDAVEVLGTARTETEADGYRGSRTRDVLTDLPGSPLIVRAPPSGQVHRRAAKA